MTITTVPNGTSGASIADAGTISTMPPTPAAGNTPSRVVAADAAPAVVSGTATSYWAELVPIPAGPARLWFLVDAGWRVLNGPTTVQFDCVQRAFLGTGSTVQVWYDGGTVSGLVVSG